MPGEGATAAQGPAMETCGSSEVGRELGQGVPSEKQGAGQPSSPPSSGLAQLKLLSVEKPRLSRTGPHHSQCLFSVQIPTAREDPSPPSRPNQRCPRLYQFRVFFSLSKQLLSAVNMSHHGGSKIMRPKPGCKNQVTGDKQLGRVV